MADTVASWQSSSFSRARPLPVWTPVFWLLMAGGAYAAYLRIFRGLGAVTNLNDHFPRGLWIGYDVLCGVGLAAGGFTLVAVVHIFNIERYQPILRPAILTAFLGYLLVILALMFDLGRPDRIWHPLVMWNPHAVMFEVAWCVMLYTIVLALEFAPVVFERLRLEGPQRVLRAVSIPLVILGVILSTLHQSSLGSLYLIVPEKLYPLWYSPLLPIFFFVSAIAVGLAMTIFESSMSARHFGLHLELPLLRDLGRILVVVLGVYVALRFEDLHDRGVLTLLFQPRYETYLFWLEVVLGQLLPIVLLLIPRVRRNANGLYLSSVLVVLGFITNRLNVSITGMEAWAGFRYIPKWTEMAVTAMIIATGFAVFGLATKYLRIFGAQERSLAPAMPALGGSRGAS
jgi:Ni/Fe-hydrogenase subunit HybB-like protein